MSDPKPETPGAKHAMTLDQLKNGELPFITKLLQFSSGMPMSPYCDSTAVKTPESCYRGAYTSTNRLLGEEYLLNFKPGSASMGVSHGIAAYHSAAARGALACRRFKEASILNERPEEMLRLPPYKRIRTPLGAVIRSRRSVRSWKVTPLSIRDVSTVLYYANGISGRFDLSPRGNELPTSVILGNASTNALRTAPSGGGLYPLDLYCICREIDGLEHGIYRFFPGMHALKKIRTIDKNETAVITGISQIKEIDSTRVNLQIAFVYKLYENSRKYGDTGMAFAFIEAGEIAQTIHLTATALGLGPCDIGGFDKTAIEDALGLNGCSTHVIHLTILGS